MASYPREYAPHRRPAAPGLPPVTKWLLIVNVGVFVLDMLGGGSIGRMAYFSVETAFLQGRLWELLSFQFIHATVGHILFNGIGLYFFGPYAERWWGSRKFLAYYLICGAGGALFYTLLLLLGVLPKAGLATPLVGASAGIFGLYAAIFVLDPGARVRLLFPPIELTIRQLAIGLAAISVGTIVFGLFVERSINEGGEAGHLGGAIMGLLLMKFPWLLGRGERPGRKVVRPKEFRRPPEPKLRPRSRVDPRAASEVDRILDKVSAEGFGSLSEEERRTLEEAGRKHS